MKKFNILLFTMIILSTIFTCKLSYSQEAAAQEGTDCGGNCTWKYDPSSQTLSFTGTGVITGKYYASNFGPVKNLIIGEGITKIGYENSEHFLNFGNVKDSKIVLPSTLQKLALNSIRYAVFKTIEISTKNITNFSWLAFSNYSGTLNKIILEPGENFVFPSDYYSYGNIDVQCKGAIADCQKVLANISNKVLTLNHYKEYDSNDKLILEYTDTGYIKYDSDGNITEKYDLNNKLLAAYSYYPDGSVFTYDGDGNLIGAKKTSPFTPAEAAALIKKGNNNRITLTFK